MKRIKVLFEKFVRHAFVYPLLRLVFHNPVKEEQIDLNSIKKIVILRYDKIGDMIVTSPIFRNLKKNYPHLQVGVFTSEQNAGLIKNNNYVDDIYILHSNWKKLLSELLRARKARYEVALNFIFNRTTSGGILANFIAPNGIKIGQGEDKYRFYFNRLLKIDRPNAHMVTTLASIIHQVFGVVFEEKDLDFEIITDPRSQQNVDNFLTKKNLKRRESDQSNSKQYIIFNLSAGKVRTLSVEQALNVGRHLGSNYNYSTVVIYAPGDIKMKETAEVLQSLHNCIIFPESGTATLFEIASIIKGALCVLTPDTSIIHFASAGKTPVLGFYTSLNTREWLPFHVPYKLLSADSGKLISSIPAGIMINEADKFITSVLKNNRM